MLVDVRLLKPDDALPTFALARLYDPSLTPDGWRAQLTCPSAQEGTFAALRGTTPRALLRYLVTRAGDGVEVLVVRWVTAFDLMDPHRAALELIAAVRARQGAEGRIIAWAPRLPCGSDFESAVAGGAVLHSVL